MKKAEVLQVRNRFQQFMYGRYGMDQLNARNAAQSL